MPSRRSQPQPRQPSARLPALLLIALALPVQATSDPSGLSLEDLLQVEVYSTARHVEKINSNASTPSVVTAADIKTFGYRNLTDILRRMPGLYVSYDRNYSYLGTRGLGTLGDWNSRVLFLVDGVRVNENIFDGAYIGNDFIIDVALIDKVEYIPGPAAAMMHGNNAFFGVVNITTKNGRQLAGGELGLEVGSGREYRQRVTLGQQLNERSDLLLSASQLRSRGQDEYFANLGGTATGLDYERADSFFAKLNWQDFTLGLMHQDRRKGIPNASYNQAFNDSRAGTSDRQSSLSLQYANALSPHSAISARFYAGSYDYRGDYAYSLGDSGLFRDIGVGRWWGGDAKLVLQANPDHHLLLGVDFQRNTRRDQFSGYLGQPLTLNDRRHDQRWGLYLHDSITLNEWLSLDAGARYDHLSTDRGELHPRLGLVAQVSPDTLLKALYGTAFRPANVSERYYYGGDNRYPNEALKPERVRSFELIADHRPGAGQQLIATLFRNEISGLIDYQPNPGADGVLGTADDFFMQGNARHLHNTGLELRYEQGLPDSGRLGGSLTLQRTRDENGQAPENAPQRLLKSWWRQPLPGNLQLGLEGHYLGPRLGFAGHHVGGSPLFHATLGAPRLISGVDLSLSVRNLLDRRTADPAPWYLAPQDRVVQDGRMVYLQAVLRF